MTTPTRQAFEQLVPDRVWVREAALDFFGLPLGARMTVVRLANGDLFVHSPVTLTDEARATIKQLGPVRYIVAPNRLHHLSVRPWAEAFPNAAVYGTRALLGKRKDVPWTGALSDTDPAPWAGELHQLKFAGNIYLDEFVFCHQSSGVLILTDLIQNHHRSSSRPQKLLSRWLGVGDRYGVPLDLRATFWNRRAARASLQVLLSLDFDQVVIAHGPVIRSGGRAMVEQAMRWLARR